MAVDETAEDVVVQAVETLFRERFMDRVNAACAALRADPVAWAEELAERALWECTLMDGLDDDPYPLESLGPEVMADVEAWKASKVHLAPDVREDSR